jgi:hypothetical protein
VSEQTVVITDEHEVVAGDFREGEFEVLPHAETFAGVEVAKTTVRYA